MKKTEIRVTIDSVEKQQKAIEILERYGELIWGDECSMNFNLEQRHLCLDLEGRKHDWWIQDVDCIQWRNRTKITLDQLEEILKNEKK